MARRAVAQSRSELIARSSISIGLRVQKTRHVSLVKGYVPEEHTLTSPEELEVCKGFKLPEGPYSEFERGDNFRCGLCPVDEANLASKPAIEQHIQERYVTTRRDLLSECASLTSYSVMT